MGPGTRTLRIFEPVSVDVGDESDLYVTLHAPAEITARRKFITELRAWADTLEDECTVRQISLDKLDALIAADKKTHGEPPQ